MFLHETKHQEQYQNLGAGNAYEKLIFEVQLKPWEDNPYSTPNKNYLEYEAQELENRVNSF